MRNIRAGQYKKKTRGTRDFRDKCICNSRGLNVGEALGVSTANAGGKPSHRRGSGPQGQPDFWIDIDAEARHPATASFNAISSWRLWFPYSGNAARLQTSLKAWTMSSLREGER